MTTTGVPSVPARPGDFAQPTSRRPPFAARRRLLVVGCLLLLAIVALAANYGPVKHYRDARARLATATAEVAALEEQKTALQSQLRKLGQSGYLEGLARQELSYARPGEHLYIVTGLPTEDVPAADSGTVGATASGAGGDAAPAAEGGRTSAGDTRGARAFEAGPVEGLGVGAAGLGASGPAVSGPAAGEPGGPGFLERILSAIANLF